MDAKLSSTSTFVFNADLKLNPIGKIGYLFSNLYNNAFPHHHIDPSILERNYQPHIDVQAKDLLQQTPSPSRFLSDLFWKDLPWSNIRQELQSITILDIGCGSGRYADLLYRLSNKQVNTYVGLDIYKHPLWQKRKKTKPFIYFKVFQGTNIIKDIPKKTNMIVSQSAFEHITNDLLFFKEIANYCILYKKPLIQVHLLPSSICLFQYLFHGIRQYTPRTISKISQLFSKFSRVYLYSLGGSHCNKLHFQDITPSLLMLKKDQRQQHPKQYKEKLLDAVHLDQMHPTQQPSFYALVIHSFPKRDVFS